MGTYDVFTDPGAWLAVVCLPVKFVVGTAALVSVTGVRSTTVSLLFAPLYYQQPGVYVGLHTDRPVELHPTLHLGRNRLLVALEPVTAFGFRRITHLREALVVAGIGLLSTLFALQALAGLARLFGWLTWLLLGDTADALAAARARLPDRCAREERTGNRYPFPALPASFHPSAGLFEVVSGPTFDRDEHDDATGLPRVRGAPPEYRHRDRL